MSDRASRKTVPSLLIIRQYRSLLLWQHWSPTHWTRHSSYWNGHCSQLQFSLSFSVWPSTSLVRLLVGHIRCSGSRLLEQKPEHCDHVDQGLAVVVVVFEVVVAVVDIRLKGKSWVTRNGFIVVAGSLWISASSEPESPSDCAIKYPAVNPPASNIRNSTASKTEMTVFVVLYFLTLERFLSWMA